MAYKIVVEKAAGKSFNKLDEPAKKHIAEFLKKLGKTESPRSFGIAMKGNSGLWRYRVGDYRIIAHIKDNTITITVTKIDHRREVYR